MKYASPQAFPQVLRSQAAELTNSPQASPQALRSQAAEFTRTPSFTL